MITDHDGWENVGECHVADFHGQRGVIAHQNVTVPQWGGLLVLPRRYIEPNLVHEMLHGLTPYPGHAEHQFGRQRTRQVTESSPWPWENTVTRTVVEPSCLATDYTTRWQSVDTSELTDPAGEDWRRTAYWNCQPGTAIPSVPTRPSASTSAIRPRAGEFSWDRPYL